MEQSSQRGQDTSYLIWTHIDISYVWSLDRWPKVKEPGIDERIIANRWTIDIF